MSASSNGREAGAASEFRTSARQRTLLSGMIVGHDGLQSQGCTVRDLSARGARIALPQGAIVPPGLYLLTSRQPVGYKARIIWRNATQAGVRFLGEHQLSATMPGELLFLWQLYLELRPRATNPFDF